MPSPTETYSPPLVERDQSRAIVVVYNVFEDSVMTLTNNSKMDSHDWY